MKEIGVIVKAVKKYIVHYANNWLVLTAKIKDYLLKNVKVSVINQSSENCINIDFYAYNLLYNVQSIICTNICCTCGGAYKYKHQLGKLDES